MTFSDIFRKATGEEPFPYQVALAEGADLPESLKAPTGSGKTAAIVLGAWLYRRRFAEPAVRAATPRRLVYCLPMRTLVSQAEREITRWLRNLGLLDEGRGIDRGDGVSIHILMGGDVDGDWMLHPERDAVIVGTLDMLLSRALNRGYGMSRYAWPWQFALLSNDSLWAFDEVQLMGVGLTTALQLCGIQRKLGTYGPAHALFASATLSEPWLSSVDHPDPGRQGGLSEDDLASPALSARRHAVKKLERARTPLAKGSETLLAKEILSAHRAGHRTIVVLNTVDVAVAVYRKLVAAARGVSVALLHSRFRPVDRTAAIASATDAAFTGIVVATQVIEAGVDVSSAVLFTELAPWASLVQRAGRCNRRGEYADARVIWIDVPEKNAAPYEPAELAAARASLEAMPGFSPAEIEAADVTLDAPKGRHVLRRRDVESLFDTTPDLAGMDLDVSRFIRESDERDLQIFWRPEADTGRKVWPTRDELCAAPVYKVREWTKRPDVRLFRWDPLGTAEDGRPGSWKTARASELYPGIVLLATSGSGGYAPDIGFAADLTEPVSAVPAPEVEAEADPDDRWSMDRSPVTLGVHACDTRQEAEAIVARLSNAVPAETVIRAAHAHDLGKAHPVFQETMRKASGIGPDDGRLWAKSAGRARHSRPRFRHELASALAWLSFDDAADRDLVAYLLAAHHGKVRLSIRALPGEKTPKGEGVRFARGVWEGDVLPEVDLGRGVVVPSTRLSLSAMEIGEAEGRPSWSAMALRLLSELGPFRLAYLEALVRAADARASARREREGRVS